MRLLCSAVSKRFVVEERPAEDEYERHHVDGERNEGGEHLVDHRIGRLNSMELSRDPGGEGREYEADQRDGEHAPPAAEEADPRQEEEQYGHEDEDERLRSARGEWRGGGRERGAGGAAPCWPGGGRACEGRTTRCAALTTGGPKTA